MCEAGAGFAIGTLVMVGAVAPAPSASATVTTETVVQVVTRPPFGKMLATVHGRSLYTTTKPCTGSCLTIWPPLLMAAGKTMPRGVAGLGTASVTIGGKHELQVTYMKKKLYTFVSDAGTSVRGNDVNSFFVAKVA